MNRQKWFFLFLALLLAAGIWLQLAADETQDWSPSFSADDDIAFGSSLLYRFIPAVFPDRPVLRTEQPVYRLFSAQPAAGVYIFIDDAFEPDSSEIKLLCNAARGGVSIFVAASRFGRELCDSLGIIADFDYYSPNRTAYSFTAKQFSAQWYSFSKHPAASTFLPDSGASWSILGTSHAPNYIRIAMGGGAVYLHGDPYVFTNYNVTDTILYRYVFTALSHLPSSRVYWDEYYKTGKNAARTPLRFVFSKEPLKYAWYCLVFSFVLFIFFQGKRRQRVIPVISAPVNAAREFIRTLAEVYFRGKYNGPIRERMILHCHEFICRALLIPSGVRGEDLIAAVAGKTGLPVSEVRDFFSYLYSTAKTESGTDLIHVYTNIRSFYKLAGIDGKK